MTKAELKRLTTGALGAVWRGPPSGKRKKSRKLRSPACRA
jgi:hypothetical protein